MKIRRAREEGLVWAVVLATDGDSSVRLQESLRHARELAPRERICAVVSSEHREWWRDPLWFLPASNVITQPGDEPIAQGVAQSMRTILGRDSAAKVVLIPSGSAVETDDGLAKDLRGKATEVLNLVKQHWPRGLGDVHAVMPAPAC